MLGVIKLGWYSGGDFCYISIKILVSSLPAVGRYKDVKLSVPSAGRYQDKSTR